MVRNQLVSAGLPPLPTTGGVNYTYPYHANIINSPTIQINAFERCTELRSVSATSTTIGGGAFDYCPLITSVSLPNATNVGAYAFDGAYPNSNPNNSLTIGTSLTTPTTITLGTRAFSQRTSNVDLILGNNVLPVPTGNT